MVRTAHLQSIIMTLMLCLFLILTPTSSAQSEVNVVIFRDADSLTLYLPPQGSVSLQGLRLEVADVGGQIISYELADFRAFNLLFPFTSIPTPICLRLERDGVNRPVPLECQGPFIISQSLAQANVFWYDALAAQDRLVRVVRVSEAITFCTPEQPICEIVFVPPSDDQADISAETQSQTLPDAAGLPGSPIVSNSDWMPYTQTFNGVEMMLVPVGCFQMGSADGRDNELPVHQQCFDTPFWIDRTEVTNQAYGSFGWWPEPQRPREVVNWFEARDFCAARGARLPTEAEWEYAARGPDNLRFAWGVTFERSRVVYGDNADLQTDFVGSRPEGVSWVGALDLGGNVWEWVSSKYLPYPYTASDGREDLTDGETWRVRRGGSWQNGEDAQTTSFRVGDNPASRLNTDGFRCARSFEVAELELVSFTNRVLMPSTPTPPPVPMVNVLASANLREGPGGSFAASGSARQGQDLVVVGRFNDGEATWLQVRDLDGRLLWLRGDLGELVNVTLDQLPQVTFP